MTTTPDTHLPSSTDQTPAGLPGRVVALDGLRGIAALIVVFYHFSCLFIPELTWRMASTTHALSHTPLAIFWNGPFAVSVFFVLSGFVMAGAAERRHGALLANTLTRYVRLAVPVTASVIFAWILLMVFPTATSAFVAQQVEPTVWADYTYQGDIPGFGRALLDGLVVNFLRGGSMFNNVLWTMQIELIGSVALYLLYWATSGKARLIVLVAAGLAIFVFFRPAYLAFVLGAIIFEFHSRNSFATLRPVLAWCLMFVGIALGAPGAGFAERVGLAGLPGRLTLGNAEGLVPVFAAAALISAVMSLPALRRLFGWAPWQWLGRISFALYLVHAPLLYTVAAAAWVRLDVGLGWLFLGFMSSVLLISHLFTVAVDEPTLRRLSALRAWLAPLDRRLAVQRAV